MTNQDNSNREGLQVHPFERSGLGKAPFRFVGMEHQDICYGEVILNRSEYEKTGVRMSTKPGGTCAHCGTYIVNMYKVESSDGKRFHVGSDCILKTADRKLVKAVSVEKRKHDKKVRDAKAVANRAEFAALLGDSKNREKLNSRTVQTYTMARNMLDYYEFMFKACGAAGIAKHLKQLKEELAR